jgi:hypothetical protein
MMKRTFANWAFKPPNAQFAKIAILAADFCGGLLEKIKQTAV